MENALESPLRAFVASLTSPEIATALVGRAQLSESSDGSRSFAQFLIRHKFSLARVLTLLLNDLVPSQSTHDSIAVCKLLIEAYGYHTEKLALSVARCIIFEEVRLQTDAGTLFRANSTATTFMASFAREIGKSYLDKTLSAVVKKIVSDTKKGALFEVDPLKVSKASEVKVNSKNYEKLVRTVVKAIVKSTPIVPTGLREICAFLRESISKRFPESKHVVVGGFFFLRFFCPAFLNPQSFMDLSSDSLTPVVRRTILLVCKFIQTMANDQNFNKEPYMMPFNPLLEELTPEIHAWFDTLATIPAGDSDRGFTNPVTIDVFLRSLKELHGFHNAQIKRLVEILASRKEDEEETSHSYFDETQLIPFLTDLSRLSQLPDILPEDKVRYESYSWEDESSQSSGPLPEALPAEKRKSGLFSLSKKSKSAAMAIPVHEAAKERRQRGISSSSGPARPTTQTSQVSGSPSQSKKWSLKNLMGQRPKSQSAEFTRSDGQVEGATDTQPAQIKSSVSAHLEENSSPRFGASSRFPPQLRKSSSGAAGPIFGRARADSQSSRGVESLKNNPMSCSASSLPGSSDRGSSRPSTKSKSSDEGSTEYRLSSDEDIEERERSQLPDDAPEEDPDTSESRPQRPPIAAPKIAAPSRGSGTWRVSDAASGQDSSDLDLSASLHDESVAHD